MDKTQPQGCCGGTHFLLGEIDFAKYKLSLPSADGEIEVRIELSADLSGTTSNQPSPLYISWGTLPSCTMRRGGLFVSFASLSRMFGVPEVDDNWIHNRYWQRDGRRLLLFNHECEHGQNILILISDQVRNIVRTFLDVTFEYQPDIFEITRGAL